MSQHTSAPAASVQERLRQLPAVDDVLHWPELAGFASAPHRLRVAAVRRAIDASRLAIQNGANPPSREEWLKQLTTALRRAAEPSLQRVINGTGVVLHTNLGRAPLPAHALQHITEVAAGYSNLEYDLASGKRGSRQDHVEELLHELTGTETAIVVNNNAAAVLLMLDSLATGGEVVVSRGELVEIGGSFRIPDVIAKSGARLVEVGTTNKTHPQDYIAATRAATVAYLKVHQSNFRQIGFTRQVSVAELSPMARERGVLLLEDLGSGSLLPLDGMGLAPEPTAPEAVQAGADVVTFSGDKLLGGPQAGIAIGRREYIERMRSNPLARALRIDKLTLAALEVVLRDYLSPDELAHRSPTLGLLSADAATLRRRADSLLRRLRTGCPAPFTFAKRPTSAQVGGGAQASTLLPSFGVVVRHPAWPPARLETHLRTGSPPVIGRIQEGELLVDVRCLLPGDGAVLVRRLREIAGEARSDIEGV
ncbi:MAG: L-seryl-tRNA(Sec) selenium transferase [Nitrospirota bacterium]